MSQLMERRQKLLDAGLPVPVANTFMGVRDLDAWEAAVRQRIKDSKDAGFKPYIYEPDEQLVDHYLPRVREILST